MIDFTVKVFLGERPDVVVVFSALILAYAVFLQQCGRQCEMRERYQLAWAAWALHYGTHVILMATVVLMQCRENELKAAAVARGVPPEAIPIIDNRLSVQEPGQLVINHGRMSVTYRPEQRPVFRFEGEY